MTFWARPAVAHSRAAARAKLIQAEEAKGLIFMRILSLSIGEPADSCCQFCAVYIPREQRGKTFRGGFRERQKSKV